MPPLPPVPSTIKLIFAFNNQGGGTTAMAKGVNLWHLQYPSGAFTATELVAVANGAMTWWGTHFKPLQNSSWQLVNVQANALDGSGVFGVSTVAPVVGSVVQPTLPPQCALCLSWVGAPSYRGGKPRTYMMGLSQTDILAPTAQLNSTVAHNWKVAGVAAIADTAFSNILSVPGIFGTVSYISKTLNPTPPHHRSTPLFWQYLSCNVHERLDSQRRRSGKESLYPAV
jgi:hypothetical protein